MKAAGLAAGYIELLFWAFFAYFVLQDPSSVDYLPKDVKIVLREQSDFFNLLAITMILSGLLWLYGVYKKNRGCMIPNQILSVLMNIALFIIFVVAPIWVVVQHLLELENRPDDLRSRILRTILYTEEERTLEQIQSGKIFIVLFVKALPSFIYSILTSTKCSLYKSMKKVARDGSEDGKLSFII